MYLKKWEFTILHKTTDAFRTSLSNTNLIPKGLLKVGGKNIWKGRNYGIKSIFVYLSVNRGGRCHLDIENSFVIIHPLHSWELNLPESDIQLI